MEGHYCNKTRQFTWVFFLKQQKDQRIDWHQIDSKAKTKTHNKVLKVQSALNLFRYDMRQIASNDFVDMQVVRKENKLVNTFKRQTYIIENKENREA